MRHQLGHVRRLIRLLSGKVTAPGAMEIGEQDFDVSWAGRHKFIIDHFRDAVENKVVIDYGCWNGGFLEYCRVHNVPCTYYGLDVVPEMIEFDRNWFGPCGDFHLLAENGRIPEDIPLVDTILLLDVLEHLPAKSEGSYLHHLGTRLKKGGKLVISCPHQNKWSFLDPAWYFGHRHYSKAKLCELLEENGFEVEGSHFNGGLFSQLDTLAFYFCKHVLRRPYESGGWMSRGLAREGQARQSGTAIYVLARKRCSQGQRVSFQAAANGKRIPDRATYSNVEGGISNIVGFMTAFWGPSGGDRHFVEVSKRWAHIYPTSALIPKRTLDTYGQDWHGVALKVLPLAAADRLGVSGTYAMRTVLALPRLPRRQKGILACSSSDSLPDVLCGVLTKKWNRDTRWAGCVFHVIPLRTSEGRIDRWRLAPVLAQKVSHFLLKRWADMILVDNSLLKEDLVRLGFPSGKTKVISMGVNRSFLDSVTPLPGRRYDACFLARLHPSKGVFDLINVWRAVTGRKPDALLAVVGGGPQPLVQELQAQIRQRGLERNVTLFGFLPDSEAYGVLKSSRLFLFPSREEGWGISIAEAMTCGLPVVAYGLPHYSEVFPRGIITVPVGDVLGLAGAIIGLLSDEEKRERVGQQARETAAQYDWDEVAQRELRLLESLFEKEPTKARPAP